MSLNKDQINSNINILGGYNNFESIPELLSNPDLNIVERTVASQKRYIKAIRETFLQFNYYDLEMLFINAMKSDMLSKEAKMRVLALQFYSTDKLFRALFNKCFIKILQSGRVGISKHDIIAFMDEQFSSGEIQAEWSRDTIDTVSRKFLTILKKLGYVEGKIKKRITLPYTGSDFMVFFHYWLIAQNGAYNTFASSYFPLLLLSKEKYLFLMKQSEIRDWVDWHYTGDKFTIEPKKPLKKYIDELSS